jgi:hypothetical protein
VQLCTVWADACFQRFRARRYAVRILRTADIAGFGAGGEFTRSHTCWICFRRCRWLAIRTAVLVTSVLRIRLVPRLISGRLLGRASLVALGRPVTGATTRWRNPSALASGGAEAPRTLRELIATPDTDPDRAARADPTANAEGLIA